MQNRELLPAKARRMAEELRILDKRWETTDNDSDSLDFIEHASLFRGYLEALYDTEAIEAEEMLEITKIAFPQEIPSAFSQFIETLNLDDFAGRQKEET